MWGIWDFDLCDWVREMPSKVDDGGEALLAYGRKVDACRRAAKHFAFPSYSDAKRAGACEVRRLERKRVR